VIDSQPQELNNRVTVVNIKLIICVASLNPRDSFCAFDKEKPINLTRFYPLDNEFENYIMDVRFVNSVLIWMGLVMFQECSWKLENILLIQWYTYF